MGVSERSLVLRSVCVCGRTVFQRERMVLLLYGKAERL